MGPNVVHPHDCGVRIQIGQHLQDVGDCLTTCLRLVSKLMKRSGRADLHSELLCTCSGHFTHDNTAGRGQRWSTVMPDGPGAAPVRAVLTFFRKSSCDRSNSSGSKCAMWSGTGSLGTAGRLDGSSSAFNVFRSPATKLAPSRACLPADTSSN